MYENDASNGLSREKLVSNYHVNHLHIHESTIVDNKSVSVYKRYPICGTRTGYLSCRRNARKSDLEVYGSGVVIFF